MLTGVPVNFLMARETNSMVGYHLMAKDLSIWLGVCGGEGTVSTLAGGRALMGVRIFLKMFLNIGLKKMFENLKIDTF